VELDPGSEQPVRRGRAGGILGLASAALLLASFRWVHHWRPLTGAIATVGALVVSVWSLRTSRASRRLAKLGIALTLVSLVALTVSGALYAAGINTAGECGGG
jgi:hypothetical protein